MSDSDENLTHVKQVEEDKSSRENGELTEQHNTEAGIKIVNSKDADATLKFQQEYDASVPEATPEQEVRLGRKVRWFIVSFAFLINLILYMDKATLSYAAILGLYEDTGLDGAKYSNVNTLFYVGYIVGQIPGTYLMQKLPVGKFLFGLTSFWTIITFLSCTMHNYGGVIAIRFFLGFVESVVVPILNTTQAQFLTADEKAAAAPLFYSSCLGVTIPVGFIAYGVLYATNTISPWKIFMIIIGGLTLILNILIFFFYPDNPTNVKGFTTEEKIWIIRRVQRTTNSSIEQKYFKKYQFKEALKDPITWLFVLYLFLIMLANNLPYQQNLLFGEMGGISNLDSTLVSVASGGFAALCSVIASYFLIRFPDTSAWSSVFWMLPSLVGSICAVALPWDNKIGILAVLTMASPVFGVPFIIIFSWATTSCSGYTKRMTRSGLIMIAYGIANIISPQLWREKDAPRYYPAWIVQIVLSFGLAPFTAIVIWFILKRRNTQRLQHIAEQEKIGVVHNTEGGELQVNIASLDLTDLENTTFIYPL
ncbi:CYFA0S01e12992g1_1 [Cyberlindnera fabianii]|uniref:CYFA0S01e12992g1_1 n=1 Tax=Cyberlindnera fabianii TaxID=36022 RepID=A0A061AS95_CYBFA|nr:High affinity cysteine transporter [Cyberlindnera fabianii]CDR37598.1 CYFA0S01e12992g1_1 [Cyberlindnera fabianii]